MRFKTTSGSGAGALGIIGTGLALALPDAKWIGWTLVGIGLLVFVFDVHIERGQIAVASSVSLKERFQRMWPQYVMAICGIGFFVGLVAFLQLNVSPPTREISEDRPGAVAAPAATVQPPVSGILLDFSNEVLPRISPPEGLLHLFEIRETSQGIQAFPVEHQFSPNEVIDWQKRFPEWPIFGISKCEITSTTNESVFYAVIPINLSFREMIPDAPGLPPVEIGGMIQAFTGGIQMRSGRVMMTQSSSFRVGRVYPQTPYVIYFVNRTKYLVDIDVPHEGTVQDFSRAGTDDFEKKLNIKLGRTTGLYLVTSVTLKSPPAPPPPTPLPPSTPEKK
jgi:hypothetical protein